MPGEGSFLIVFQNSRFLGPARSGQSDSKHFVISTVTHRKCVLMMGGKGIRLLSSGSKLLTGVWLFSLLLLSQCSPRNFELSCIRLEGEPLSCSGAAEPGGRHDLPRAAAVCQALCLPPACDPGVPPNLLEGERSFTSILQMRKLTHAGSKFVKHRWNVDSGTRISIQVGLDSKTLDPPIILFYTLGKQCFRIYIRHFQGHWPILTFSVMIRQQGSDSIHFSFYLPPFLPIFLFKYPFL